MQPLLTSSATTPDSADDVSCLDFCNHLLMSHAISVITTFSISSVFFPSRQNNLCTGKTDEVILLLQKPPVASLAPTHTSLTPPVSSYCLPSPLPQPCRTSCDSPLSQTLYHIRALAVAVYLPGIALPESHLAPCITFLRPLLKFRCLGNPSHDRSIKNSPFLPSSFLALLVPMILVII